MATALTWGTRTQIASGQVGSYSYPNSNYYTFYLYTTATLNNRSANVYVEYIVVPNGATYSQYSGPYWELYIDGAQKATAHQSAVTSTVTLTTYNYTLNADSSGAFASSTIQGKWFRDGSSGYPPKDLTISGSITLPEIDDISGGGSGGTSATSGNPLSYWNGTEWVPLYADYVIEQGTSGAIWTYRKWASGISECWGYHTRSITGSAWEGATEFNGQTYTYPSNLFVARPTLSVAVESNPSVIVRIYQDGSKTATGTLGAYRPGTSYRNQSVSITFSIHAIGRWKE